MTKEEILEFVNKDDLIKEYLTLVKNYNDDKSIDNEKYFKELFNLFLKDFLIFTINKNVLKERSKEDLIEAISILRKQFIKETEKKSYEEEENIEKDDNGKQKEIDDNITIEKAYNISKTFDNSIIYNKRK